MKKDSRSIHVRLNLNRSDHLKAWEYLEQLEQEEKLPYNQLIARAIIELGERAASKNTSIDEMINEIVDTCVQKIISAVEDSLHKTLPAYIAGCFAATSSALYAQQSQSATEPTPTDDDKTTGSEQISAEDIDWDFLGEG